MIIPHKEMFDISRIGQAQEKCLILLLMIDICIETTKKAFIGCGRFFGWCLYLTPCPNYLCFKASFAPIYVSWWKKDCSLWLISFGTPFIMELRPKKIFESKTWLDSKILINICGFFSTTVIFASLFSLFFASVDRFSFRVTNHRIRNFKCHI